MIVIKQLTALAHPGPHTEEKLDLLHRIQNSQLTEVSMTVVPTSGIRRTEHRDVEALVKGSQLQRVDVRYREDSKGHSWADLRQEFIEAWVPSAEKNQGQLHGRGDILVRR